MSMILCFSRCRRNSFVGGVEESYGFKAQAQSNLSYYLDIQDAVEVNPVNDVL